MGFLFGDRDSRSRLGMLHVFSGELQRWYRAGGKQGKTLSKHNTSVLCCAVLCCAVLCCAVLCCAVLCCAVLCCAVLCCAVLCTALLCCAVLCRSAG
jgi:hypothetical protein